MNSILNKLEGWGIIERRGTNRFTLITVHLEERFGGVQQKTQSTQGFESDFDEISVQQSSQQTSQQTSQQSSQQTSHFKQDYKDYKDYKDIPPLAREDEKFFGEMRRGGTQWQEDTCRVLGISFAELSELIDMFETECRAKSATHVSWRDITSHFIDWGRKEMQSRQKQKSYGNNNRASDRGAYEVTGLEDYSGERL